MLNSLMPLYNTTISFCDLLLAVNCWKSPMSLQWWQFFPLLIDRCRYCALFKPELVWCKLNSEGFANCAASVCKGIDKLLVKLAVNRACWELLSPMMPTKSEPSVCSHFNSYRNSRDNWCRVGGDVGSARYEPALLPPCPTISVLSYSN